MQHHSVHDIFSHTPFFASINLPTDKQRLEAVKSERFLDSVFADIDMIEFPSYFCKLSEEDKVNMGYFFTILAEDLLLAEEHQSHNQDAQKAWKSEAIIALAYKLEHVFQKICPKCPPTPPNSPSLQPLAQPASPAQAPLESPRVESSAASSPREVSAASSEESSEASVDSPLELNSPEDEQPVINFATPRELIPHWKHFSERCIRTKASYFTRISTSSQLRIDSVTQQFIKEVDRLAVLWAAKEVFLSRSRVWKRVETRHKHEKEINELLEKVSTLEKFELLFRAVHFLHSVRAKKAIDLITKSFLEGYPTLTENEKSAVLRVLDADEKLHQVRALIPSS